MPLRRQPDRGAEVLISGPVALKCPEGAELVQVNTADDMYKAVMRYFDTCGIAIMAAAVADYRVAEVSDVKIKRPRTSLWLSSSRIQIFWELGRIKGDKILDGFCAETCNLMEHAACKMEAKNLDMIVANDVTMEGAGFGTDTNIIKIMKRDGTVLDLPLMSKLEAANRILDEIAGIRRYNNDDGKVDG